MASSVLEALKSGFFLSVGVQHVLAWFTIAVEHTIFYVDVTP